MVVLKECRVAVKYGYFDEKNKEYVVTRPDTPTPWINYLGNGGFGGIISNNAGGLLFDGDPGTRRLTRYRYNNLPMDRPGRLDVHCRQRRFFYKFLLSYFLFSTFPAVFQDNLRHHI